VQETSDTPPKHARVLAYDALRLFSILSVVAIHSLMPLRTTLPAHAPALVIDDVLHYAVPVFVFISGALLWGRPWRSGPGEYRSFMITRLKAVGLPYLAWALVFLALAVATAANPLAKLAEAPGLLLTGHVWYHLYFVPMLLTLYALTPLAVRALRRSPEGAVLAAYALRLLLWPLVSPWLQANAPDLAWSWASHLAAHLPHMMLGGWFALRIELFPRWLRRAWPVLVAYGLGGLTAISVGATASWPWLLRRTFEADAMACAVLGLALAARELEPHYRRFGDVILAGSALSFGVYFVHPLALEALWRGVDAAGLAHLWTRWWAVPAAWFIISGVSLALAWALSRYPATAWLVGAHTRATKGEERR